MLKKKFIGEEIQVFFEQPPLYSKKPDCPHGFIWLGKEFVILKLLTAREDYSRRGSQENNMSPERASRAKIKGSWGVGRYYFQVEVTGGRKFEIYFDRAPEKSDDRLGHWFLLSEIVE